MTHRPRELPPWMALKEKAKPKQATTESRKVSRTIYCMNEKELVEAAVAFIRHVGASDCDTSHKDHQVNRDRRPASTVRNQDGSHKMEETLDESCGSDAQDRTYISETDMDTVDDAQTVSPHLCGSGQQSKGQRSIQAQDYPSPVALEPGTEVVAETPPTEVEDDDALKFVREIFFT